ncbi:MAG: DUF6364 family protein [Ghiorsea sp.]|nr:DUF6364 family protein [Ghiorsea sp.]
MATKLTLSLNEQTIRKAKVWAKEHHASLSGLVENYFESLVSNQNDMPPLASKTKALSGMFKAHEEGLSYKEMVRKYKAEP